VPVPEEPPGSGDGSAGSAVRHRIPTHRTYREDVSGRPSKLTLLRPSWLLLHALTLAACAAMIWLGLWQWRAAVRHHGDLRNYAYAVQWWAFVGFTVLMWFRVVGDHLRPAEEEPSAEQAPATPASRYLGYTPAPSSPAVETDPERRRLNAYLAQLSAADREAAE
jgi:DNA-binding transcriptional regulator of glucitol operon